MRFRIAVGYHMGYGLEGLTFQSLASRTAGPTEFDGETRDRRSLQRYFQLNSRLGCSEQAHFPIDHDAQLQYAVYDSSTPLQQPPSPRSNAVVLEFIPHYTIVAGGRYDTSGWQDIKPPCQPIHRNNFLDNFLFDSV